MRCRDQGKGENWSTNPPTSSLTRSTSPSTPLSPSPNHTGTGIPVLPVSEGGG